MMDAINIHSRKSRKQENHGSFCYYLSNPIKGIAAKQIDKPICVSGNTTCYAPVIGYSLGAYCKSVASNGNAFGAATAGYGYYSPTR